MHLSGRDIIVVGGGIAGLAAAVALAQRHARVRIFERAAAFREVGAGIQVGPNGVAVLEALGLRDAAESVAAVPQAVELRDYRSRSLIARVPLGHDAVGRYGRPYWNFHRADLLAMLASGAQEAGVEFVFGAEIASVRQTKAGGCEVTSTAGDVHSCDILIAADGLRSRVRSTIFAGSAPRFTRNVAWRGLIQGDRVPEALRLEGAAVHIGPRRHIVTYPLRNGRLYNFVAIEERERWAAEGWLELDDPANLRRAFAGWAPEIRKLLEAVDETFLWGLFDHPPLNNWVGARIALAGDACHPTLPFLAQGATMALEDAWVLAAELDTAPDVETGLRAYEARRKPRATRVQRASLRNGRIFHLGPGLRPIVNLGLRASSSLAPGLLAGRFDWLYGADVVSAQATR